MTIMIAQIWKEVVVRIDEGCAAKSISIQVLNVMQVKLEKCVQEEIQKFEFSFQQRLNHPNQTLGSKVPTILLKGY